MKVRSFYAAAFTGLCMAMLLNSGAAAAYRYRPGFTSQKLPRSVKQRITGCSYPRNNYSRNNYSPNNSLIQYKELRYLKMRYIDFQGNTRNGEMIVHKKIARKTLKIFYRLYQMEYPIQKMKLVDEYQADDEQSMAANNTSAFNYRMIAGTNRLSKHGYGLAIDINPRINPCVTASAVSPSNGRAYTERKPSLCKGKYRDHMIHKGDPVYRLFRRYGFSWGGDWKSKKDYQHFEWQ